MLIPALTMALISWCFISPVTKTSHPSERAWGACLRRAEDETDAGEFFGGGSGPRRGGRRDVEMTLEAGAEFIKRGGRVERDAAADADGARSGLDSSG